jgi:taurine dioxygenase
MASAVSIEPSGLGFGARVVGVDLSGRVSAEDLAAIRAAWLEYQVLVFPGQEVDEERQIAFGRNFGALSAARLGPKTDTPQYVLYVATKVEEGQRQAVQPDGELLFHMDQSYLAAPNRATMLFAITVPEVGGDTLFASAQGRPSLGQACPQPIRGRSRRRFRPPARDQAPGEQEARPVHEPPHHQLCRRALR